MKTPKVSIICFAYNQASFIRDALDGFVMQKTNFPFEVLIHDDASADGTADIIREYAEKYPDIIKPIFQTENQYSKGIAIGCTYLYPRVRGKYVAVCDGDDFWTDAYKLQKQVDFLDANPEYNIVYHPVSVLWQDGRMVEAKISRKRSYDVPLSNLLYNNCIPNCSVMYRWCPNGLDITTCRPRNIYPGDWFVHLLHAKTGKVRCLSEIMAIYRRHSGGVSFVDELGKDELHNKYGVKELNFFMNVETQIAPKTLGYHNYVRHKACEILVSYVKKDNFDSAKQILSMCPDLVPDYIDICKATRWKRYFNRLLSIFILFLLILTVGVVL